MLYISRQDKACLQKIDCHQEVDHMNQISEVMKDFLKEEELEVFSSQMSEFSNLHADEEILAVINPVGLENLYLQTCSSGAVLSFGNWKQEYGDSLQDVEDLKSDVDGILNSRMYVWSVVACDKLMVGLVSHDDIRYLADTNKMGMDFMGTAPFLESVAAQHGNQDFLFWDPETARPESRYFLC